MNTSHYPNIDLCKKLTEAEFPETENTWIEDEEWDWIDIVRKSMNDLLEEINEKKWIPYNRKYEEWEYVCPSVAELLDELPPTIKHEWVTYTLFMTKFWSEYRFFNWQEIERICKFMLATLSDSLSENYLWLKENNYLPN